MPTPNDHRRMQLDPYILDFLKALEAQGVPPLWTLSPTSARAGAHSSGYKDNESRGEIYARPTHSCNSSTCSQCNGSISRWHRLPFSKQYASAAAISQGSFCPTHFN